MRFIVGSTIAVFVLSVSGSASADPVTITIGDFSNGGTATLHAPGTLADNLGVELGGVTISGPLGTFLSFCVDLQHYISPGVYTADVDTMSNWNNEATPAHASLGPGAASWLYLTYVGAAASDSVTQAGLSLAIWNSLYNDVYNVTTVGSGFWATNASNATYITKANELLSNLETYSSSNGVFTPATWLRTTNSAVDFGQDFVAPVPEASTVVLFAVAVGAMLLLAWYRLLPRAIAARRVALVAAILLLAIPSMAFAFEPVRVPEPATSALLVASSVAAIAAAYARRAQERWRSRRGTSSRRGSFDSPA